jgi:hypothetical protein
MSKETIAAIISDRTMINNEGLVQNAEEVAQAIIDAMGPPVAVSADIGAETEAAPGQVAPTDEDLDRQRKAEFDITVDLIWRLSEKRENQPRLHRLPEASFIVETVLRNPEDQLLDAKQWLTQMRDPEASSGNWLQKYVSDLIARRHCFENGCTTCGGAFTFRSGLIARIAEIVGTAGSNQWGLNADGAKLLVDLMSELKPPEHPSWEWDKEMQLKWEKATQLMIHGGWGVLGKPIVQDRLGQSWAGLVAEKMIADEEARQAQEEAGQERMIGQEEARRRRTQEHEARLLKAQEQRIQRKEERQLRHERRLLQKKERDKLWWANAASRSRSPDEL